MMGLSRRMISPALTSRAQRKIFPCNALDLLTKIDFDAGQVLADGFEDAADALLTLLVDTASGRETRSEVNGERDIAIWKSGVTL